MMVAGVAPADVTVVVPTRNEEANIGRFLASVPPEVALVVVDSGDDDTATIVTSLRPERTRVIRIRANVAVARQCGFEASDTPWVLFADADVAFGPGYFDRLAAVALDPATAGIVGVKGTAGGYDRYHRWFVRGQGALMAIGIPAATGSNMLVRRDVLAAVGGFDSELSVNEDSELMFRVRRRGLVMFRPDLSVLSFDHRRLDAGVARKLGHGAVRNTALYLGLFPRQVRRSDWGYWRAGAARAGASGPAGRLP